MPYRQLPLVTEPSGAEDVNALTSWICDHGEQLEDDLRRHGGVLFRGFHAKTAQDFETIAKAIDPNLSPAHQFDGPEVRRWLTEYVCEALDSTITQNSELLTFHNENSFLTRHPSRVMFCCLNAPDRGGETPIVDCRDVYKSIPATVLERFQGRSLLSSISIPFATVASNCGTDDRREIEKLCEENGVLEVSWLENGDLKILAKLPVTFRHPDTGETAWFNRIHGAYTGSWTIENPIAAMYVKSFPFKLRYFAYLAKFAYWILRRRLLFKRWSDGGRGLRLDDGSQLSLKDQLLITKAFWKNAVVLPWQKGDILILDNRLVAHGRMPHEGQRKVLFCMNLPSFIDEDSATR